MNSQQLVASRNPKTALLAMVVMQIVDLNIRTVFFFLWLALHLKLVLFACCESQLVEVVSCNEQQLQKLPNFIRIIPSVSLNTTRRHRIWLMLLINEFQFQISDLNLVQSIPVAAGVAGDFMAVIRSSSTLSWGINSRFEAHLQRWKFNLFTNTYLPQ